MQGPSGDQSWDGICHPVEIKFLSIYLSIYLLSGYTQKLIFFQSPPTKFRQHFYVILLANKIYYCLSANHIPEFWSVICTGVTVFALVLLFNCTALSQSDTSNFFTYVIKLLNMVETVKRFKVRPLDFT